MTSEQRIQNRRGAALTEFAVSLPVLVLLAVAGLDLGRLYIEAVALNNAPGVGSFYGAQSNILAGDTKGIEAAAKTDGKNYSGITVTVTQYCECPGGTEIACEDAGTTDCGGGYGQPRAYVVTEATRTFNTLGSYPFLGDTFDLKKEAYMRVE